MLLLQLLDFVGYVDRIVEVKIKGAKAHRQGFHGTDDSSQALLYLWHTGELTWER